MDFKGTMTIQPQKGLS
jgi:calcium-dependent protein kinase